jgi:putative addiction module component (TIGR02574 family)
MSINDIIDEALTLKPQERYLIIEKLNDSLNVPNPEVEKAWIEESMRRSEAYDRGELETVTYEEVFGK